MEKKKTLLEKYDIPIGHLDFNYIANCKNARELEKILTILRSGEEGFYPDLTQRAEDKLSELNPRSKLFRMEQRIHGRDFLANEDWKPIYDWTRKMRANEQRLVSVKTALEMDPSLNEMDLFCPPIRRAGSITANKYNNNNNNNNKNNKDSNKTTERENHVRNAVSSVGAKPKHIKAPASTDYRKWDKYDADEEVIRMELSEERIKEEVERKNRLNVIKSKVPQKITDIESETKKMKALQLANVEREKMSEDYRMRGNDYYRVKEYSNALAEYTRAICMSPSTSVAAYNNRAMINIKMRNYNEAIEDCERCLELDPKNIKARLRLAECNTCLGNKRRALIEFHKVLEIDPTNKFAVVAAAGLAQEFGEEPPAVATRLRIKEEIIPKSFKTKANNTDDTNKAYEFPTEKPTTSAAMLEDTPKSTTIKLQENVATAATKPQKVDIYAPKSQGTNNTNNNNNNNNTTTTKKDYDLANLIKPNRVVKNKLASAAEALGTLRGARDNKMSKPSLSMTQKPMLRMSSIETNPMGKVLIEEI